MTMPPPEFSRLVAVEALDESDVMLTVEADAAERARLAKRFGLVAVGRLTGTVRVAPEEGGAVFRVAGSFLADVVQACVVTLEELPVHVEDSFERRYSALAEPEAAREEYLELDAEEPLDPVVDGHIDVGEAIAEELALSLDPFPRKPGISFTEYSSGPDGAGGVSGAATGNAAAAEGPFAALRRLKDRLK